MGYDYQHKFRFTLAKGARLQLVHGGWVNLLAECPAELDVSLPAVEVNSEESQRPASSQSPQASAESGSKN